jgi:hypothetical protein
MRSLDRPPFAAGVFDLDDLDRAVSVHRTGLTSLVSRWSSSQSLMGDADDKSQTLVLSNNGRAFPRFNRPGASGREQRVAGQGDGHPGPCPGKSPP